jgi:hypothetical protein
MLGHLYFSDWRLLHSAKKIKSDLSWYSRLQSSSQAHEDGRLKVIKKEYRSFPIGATWLSQITSHKNSVIYYQ